MYNLKVSRSFFLLFLIILFAFVLRFIWLSSVPHSLHSDEVYAGYVGYKIVQSGSDIYGNILPLYINKFGDYRPAGIFYIVGVFTNLFGLNILTIRLPTAFIGAITLIPLYILTYQISKNKYIALMSAFFLAISPWHIVVSRATSEQVVALFLIVSAVSSLLYGLSHQKNRYVFLAYGFFLLSYFFYHTPRVFIPSLLVMFLSCIYLLQKKKDAIVKKRRLLVVLTAVFILFTVFITFTKFGSGRFEQTSLFQNKDILTKITVLSDIDQGDIFAARVFHNKALVFSKEILDQYLSYFSTQFLFVVGGLPDRYVVPEHGLFYYIEVPFLVAGFYFLINRRQRFFYVPLIWILCGPLAASLTLEDSPNIQRALFMLPGFQILDAYGLYYSVLLVKRQKRFIFIVPLAVCLLFSMIYFFHQYAVHSSVHLPFRRNAGVSELMTELKKRESDVDRIYLTKREDMHVYFMYHNYRSYPLLNVSSQTDDVTIGKYVFLDHDCPEDVLQVEDIEKRALIVSFEVCLTEGEAVGRDVIKRNDSTTAFYIREVIN